MHPEKNQSSIDTKLLQQRLTALWALSESAMGGFLHAFKLPFTGLIVSSAAVLIISGIARYGFKRGEILKATLIVILVKVVVSPHSPINAHFAVLLQGLIGEILFASKKYFTITTVFYAVITALLSATQKILVLTLLFGFSLWTAIDSFFKYVLTEFPITINAQSDFSFSQMIVSIYLAIHFIVGLLSGFFSVSLLKNISEVHVIKKDFKTIIKSATADKKSRRKKKFWWRKSTGAILILILAATAVYSYFNEPENSLYLTIIIILLRSFGITIIWYFIIAPFANKYISQYYSRQKSKHANEINEILNLIPIFKMIVSESYSLTADRKGLERYKTFLILVLSNIIFFKEEVIVTAEMKE